MSGGLDAYAGLKAQVLAAGASMEFGDPQATAEAILKIVDAPNGRTMLNVPPAAVYRISRRRAWSRDQKAHPATISSALLPATSDIDGPLIRLGRGFPAGA